MEEKLCYLGFSLFPGIGPVLFDKLIQHFGNANNAWEAPKKELGKILSEKLIEEFITFRSEINLENEYEKIVQMDIQLLSLEDKAYPEILKKIPHSPFLLYVKGNISTLSLPKNIGIVGTRKITPYGKEVTRMITEELVNTGFTIVSGLAFGVDAMSHMTTIDNNGKTIAVLGCGVDCCTPPNNQKIYDSILASGGAIVSTFPPGMQATTGSFPARNAIIAGLSLAIVVTEGAADSGALITADYAKKFNRPVFAVPGPITSGLSKGPNSLLQHGGIAVTNVKDILDSLGIITNVKTHPPAGGAKVKSWEGMSLEEKEILNLLETGPLHFDEIVRTIGKDSKSIGSLLSLLELKGVIRSSVDGKYSL